MFGSQILDIAIAMIFFYLFVSLICSALREGVESLTKARAMNLERGIRELLDDPSGKAITQSLFDHPQLSGLFKGAYDPDALKAGFSGFGKKLLPNNNMGRWARNNLPSYVPAANFAVALLDVTANGSVTAPNNAKARVLSLDAVRGAVASLPGDKLQRAVLNAVDLANGDLAQAQKNLEDWFNSAMDRVSGWYKRRTQLILFLLGLAAAVMLNLDSFAVLHVVSSDKTIRDGLIAAAETANAKKDDPKLLQTLADGFQKLGVPMGWDHCLQSGPTPGAAGGMLLPQCMSQPVPQSVRCSQGGTCVYVPLTWIDVFKMVLGWIITAAAVTLGAPFWFDTLSKFMSVRSSLKPDDKPASSPDPAASPSRASTPVSPPPPPSSPPGNFSPNEWNAGYTQAGVL